MTSPRISIVIPSFNKAHFIYETLGSIVSQKYRNLEVIIQDGGSTDGTLEIVKKYAKKYPNLFSWESKKDKGQLDAINKGMRKAKGDILTYINADDYYVEGALSAVAKAYKNNPGHLWFAGRGVVVNASGNQIANFVTTYKNLLLRLNKYSLLLMTNYLMQPSVFITKAAYKKYGPFTGNNKFVTEYDLWLKLGKNQMPVVINKVLSNFRFEPSTISATQSNLLLKADFEVVNKYTSNYIILLIHNIHNHLRILFAKITLVFS